MAKNIDFLEMCGFHEIQKKAIQVLFSTFATFFLYGGAAGGGKSYFIRWCAIYVLLFLYRKFKVKNITVGIFCEDYPSLHDRHISKIDYEFPEWLGKWNQTRKEFKLKKEWGGGIISFRNLDEPQKYLSVEFAWIFVDELTRNKQNIFDFLRMRLRWPGIPGKYCKFVGATNPGGDGHVWVKKFWIDRNYEDTNLTEDMFEFVQAKANDNPYLDPGYWDMLNSLPDAMRRAYAQGDWDVFEGQYFTEFRRAVHVVPPFDPRDENTLAWFKTLPVYGGFDYGFSKPACHLWGKFDRDTGTWWIYDEFYATHHTYEMCADVILLKGVTKTTYADPAIWAKKDNPKSGYDLMIERRNINIKRAVNDRVIGWIYLKTLLLNGKIKIFPNCRKLIETFPVLMYDKNKVEDLDSNGEDHALDALRYLVNTHRKDNPQTDVLTYIKMTIYIKNIRASMKN